MIPYSIPASTARQARVIVVAMALTCFAAGCEHPPVDAQQTGYRGTGMVDVSNPRLDALTRAASVPQFTLPAVPDDGGQRAGALYANVQIPELRELSAAQFARLMAAITQWVSPTQGCTYCHAETDLASDEVYTKVVSRRMLEMTIAINSDWSDHVGATGVSCHTCHRGQPVPEVTWSQQAGDPHARGFAAQSGGQNMAAPAVGVTSLPFDPFSRLIGDSQDVLVQATSALPQAQGRSIQDTEQTYGLMVHMSTSLGVNCTYCHNSRAFRPWEESTPQRVTAWHGIRMLRSINSEFIDSVASVFPPERLGPLGDPLKAHCGTCHRGLAQPLGGTSAIAEFPELAGTN